MNVIKLIFNKNTLIVVSILTIIGIIYFQNNKIESLLKENELKTESISELKTTVKTLENNIKIQEDNIKNQIQFLKINIDKKINREKEVSEKVLKESKRDLNKIFERKISLSEKEYNKSVKRNIDNFNNGNKKGEKKDEL